ncbi:hypothetical protein AU468_13425 [Alkalispirochaeta sphaeroplastigenens]|uniref:Uncharacterized protein n=1 Tax=Alkalispirochaeta sphaeroplastigenens TaxID=1187066 RepID=A0A2S4JFQ4_9SPIO|nr:hypothetical protein AU468_13425 [Alkalispirochaeta sphaeroplastigenens]
MQLNHLAVTIVFPFLVPFRRMIYYFNIDLAISLFFLLIAKACQKFFWRRFPVAVPLPAPIFLHTKKW